MKRLIIAIAMSLVFVNTAHADGYYVLDTTVSESKCSNTDLAIGIGAGVTIATVAAVASVASAPLIGPGIAAGTKVGVSGALSGAIFTKSTLPAILVSVPTLGTIYSVAGYYGSCVWNSW